MAEFTGRGMGNTRFGLHKKSTRIDMTAMVDVAFLLLTFFVLTTYIDDKKMVELTPPIQTSAVDIVEDKIMTLILCSGDSIVYYTGMTQATPYTTSYSAEGIRNVLQSHLKKAQPLCDAAQTSPCWDPIFRILPRYNCRYQNVVSILDEMSILSAPKYSLQAFTLKDSIQLAGLYAQ